MSVSSGLRTILFTDVQASTDLTGRFGDAKARDLLREHEGLTRDALAEHGGTEIKTMGDGFMASFTSASGALDAAIAMQRAMTEHFAETETPIRIRVGINAGEPIEEDDDLYGTAVIQAARVMGLADGGQILVTDTVRNLVAGKDYRFSDHGSHDLKGFEEAARLFEVAWELIHDA
jgi:class 3 adenylate cyclase